jgi:DNA-binding transcriptional regulator YhcF (GntR family)
MSADGVARRLRDALAHPSGAPLSARLVEHLWQEVVDDTLPSGARLPTTRELAVALGTSPRTIARAYEELERLGVASIRPGEGTFVSLAPPDEDARQRYRALADVARDAVERVRALGLTVDELVEAVAEWRGIENADAARDDVPSPGRLRPP